MKQFFTFAFFTEPSKAGKFRQFICSVLSCCVNQTRVRCMRSVRKTSGRSQKIHIVFFLTARWGGGRILIVGILPSWFHISDWNMMTYVHTHLPACAPITSTKFALQHHRYKVNLILRKSKMYFTFGHEVARCALGLQCHTPRRIFLCRAVCWNYKKKIKNAILDLPCHKNDDALLFVQSAV